MAMSLVSVIIATFNSARTLPMVLTSIRKQTYPQKRIEILVVDGGSTDTTLAIAKRFHCRIITNPKVEPVSAKLLGYACAKGNYIIYLDADEIIENLNSLRLKLLMFKRNKRIKAVIGSGYKNPNNASFLTRYINDFGDPFSFFIYRLSKDSKYYYFGLKQLFSTVEENHASVVFDFSKRGKGLLLELGAANSMMDLKYLRKEFPLFTSETFAHLFQHLISKLKYIGMIKDDSVIHFSTPDLRSYLNKINWRIKNNIYHTSGIGISGFSGREKFQPEFSKIKKYLFIPYAYSIFLPFFDSIYLAFTRQRIDYLLHVPLTIITATLILYYLVLKMIGYSPQLRTYDESRIVSNSL